MFCKLFKDNLNRIQILENIHSIEHVHRTPVLSFTTNKLN